MPHILVVDDNPINLRVASRILKEAGCTGALAQTEEQCLAVLAKVKFDALLLDVNLGASNGWAVAATVLCSYPQLPIAMLSGYDTEKDFQATIDCGARIHLVKPLTLEKWKEFHALWHTNV